MGARHTAREAALKIIYRSDMRDDMSLDELLAHRPDEGEKADREFVTRLAKGVLENKESLDAQMGDYLTGWTPDRLGVMERAVLRLALFEIENESATPGVVVVDEAIELAKRFCGDDSTKLINGVLDRALKETGSKNTTKSKEK